MTPEEFLALNDADEDDTTDTTEPVDPLWSIAASLAQLAEHFTAEHITAEDDTAARYLELRREYDEIETLHGAAQGRLDRVLEICRPSTSKLAISIRAVLEPMPPAPDEHPADPAATAGDTEEPGADATVEEWREHARSRGYAGPDVDTANRSQIRTMLGVAHGTPGTRGAAS